jgi:hypothetical protein
MLELRPCGGAIHEFWHRVADKFRLPPHRTSVLADLSVTNVTGRNLATIADALVQLSSSATGQRVLEKLVEMNVEAIRFCNLNLPLKISIKDSSLALSVGFLKSMAQGTPLSHLVE